MTRSLADAVLQWIVAHWQFAAAIVAAVGAALGVVVKLYQLYDRWQKKKTEVADAAAQVLREREQQAKLDTIADGVKKILEAQGKLHGAEANVSAEGQIATATEHYTSAAKTLAQSTDEKSKEAFELLVKGDTTAAKQVFRKILEEKRRDATTENKEASIAARNLAALMRLEDAEKAAELYTESAELDPDNVQSLIDSGDLFIKIGQLDRARGAYAKALERAERAQSKELKTIARKKLGDVLDSIGDGERLDTALGVYRESLKVRERLAKDDNSYKRDQAISHEKIGDVLYDLSNPLETLKALRDLAIVEHLAGDDHEDHGWLDSLIVKAKLNQIMRATTEQTEALDAYRASLEIRAHFHDVENPASVGDLIMLHEKIGDMLVAQRDLEGAERAYRESFNAAQDMNVNLTRLHDKLGDVLMADQERLEDAMKCYEATLQNNGTGERESAKSHEKIGDAQRCQGNRKDARDEYKLALSTLAKLAHTDPENMGTQIDLSILQEKLGDMLVKQRAKKALVEACEVYVSCKVIREKLAKLDPNNAHRQRVLARSYERIGEAQGRLGNEQDARDAWDEAYRIYKSLMDRNPGNAQEPLFLVEPLLQIGALKGGIEGQKELAQAHAILQGEAAVVSRLDSNGRAWVAKKMA